MELPRRRLLSLATSAVALPTVSRIARAQVARAEAYPSRPVTIIVPVPPGGVADPIARILADHLTVTLGQPVVVENVTGAGGSIAVGRAARAAADGYTPFAAPIPTKLPKNFCISGRPTTFPSEYLFACR